jgi:NAD(P)-dependent dehydrogenase (short-subunit alcohol dehydrogenase family)
LAEQTIPDLTVSSEGRLAGKRVLITGTGGGQGAAAQELFCQHGARVVGCDLRPGAADVGASGGATLGGIDVLYNNASAPAIAPFGEMTLEQWRFTLVNELEIVFTVTSAAWPPLIEAGGSIINTASGTASMGIAPIGFAAHAAAKAGVLGFTRQLAAEGAAHGVRANAISPGFVDTPATRDMPQKAKDYILRSIYLMDGLIESIDIAYCALYLASDESRYVTGAEFVVDAGSAGGRPA